MLSHNRAFSIVLCQPYASSSTASSLSTGPIDITQLKYPMPTLGGFVITIDECAKWASRISKRPLEECQEETGVGILIKYMKKNGYDIAAVCYPATVPKVMIVTQYGPSYEGWMADDDPSKLEQFEEGLTERITRKALDRAGVVGYEFVTSHGRYQ